MQKKEDNLELSDDILLKLTENNPHNILSLKDFDVKLYQNMTYNKFLVSGKCINIYESNYTVVELSGSRWDILTPIKRLSFRRFYAPKSYLTIYDFDWSKFFGKEKTNP